ncbi:MAG: hypothetical protein QM773_18745 [Hyphomonadaceae bacterium]
MAHLRASRLVLAWMHRMGEGLAPIELLALVVCGFRPSLDAP